MPPIEVVARGEELRPSPSAPWASGAGMELAKHRLEEGGGPECPSMPTHHMTSRSQMPQSELHPGRIFEQRRATSLDFPSDAKCPDIIRCARTGRRLSSPLVLSLNEQPFGLVTKDDVLRYLDPSPTEPSSSPDGTESQVAPYLPRNNNGDKNIVENHHKAGCQKTIGTPDFIPDYHQTVSNLADSFSPSLFDPKSVKGDHELAASLDSGAGTHLGGMGSETREGAVAVFSANSSLPEYATCQIWSSTIVQSPDGARLVQPSLSPNEAQRQIKQVLQSAAEKEDDFHLPRRLSLNNGPVRPSVDQVERNGRSEAVRLNRAQTLGLQHTHLAALDESQRFALARAIPRIANLVLSTHFGNSDKVMDDSVAPATCIRNIVYLEPSPSSKLFMRIEKFWRWTIEQFGRNEAHMYRPHISATGFFDLASNARELSESVLVEHLASRMRKLTVPHSPPQPKVLGLKRLTSTNLVLSVSTPEPYLNVLQSLSHLHMGIRPKIADHISLAYANKYVKVCEERYNPSIVNHLEVKAREMVTCRGNPCVSSSKPGAPCAGCQTGVTEEDVQWDLVLYRVACSSDIETPHEFTQLKRWRIT